MCARKTPEAVSNASKTAANTKHRLTRLQDLATAVSGRNAFARLSANAAASPARPAVQAVRAMG